MSLEHILIFSALLFVIGILGIVINSRNILVILMSVEIMLLAVNVNFVAFSYYLNDITGHIYSIFVLTVAAAEIAVAISILVVFYRLNKTVDINKANLIGEKRE